MRVAVTGAAGRIGTKVVALLIERGHSVVAIDKNVPDGHDGDDGHDGGDTADRADGGGGGRARPRAHWLAADVTSLKLLLRATTLFPPTSNERICPVAPRAIPLFAPQTDSLLYRILTVFFGVTLTLTIPIGASDLCADHLDDLREGGNCRIDGPAAQFRAG